jgi:hypothetical protein
MPLRHSFSRSGLSTVWWDGDCSIRLLRQSSVFMVACMGRTSGCMAVQDISDRAPDHAETETVELRMLLTNTPGVRDAHE